MSTMTKTGSQEERIAVFSWLPGFVRIGIERGDCLDLYQTQRCNAGIGDTSQSLFIHPRRGVSTLNQILRYLRRRRSAFSLTPVGVPPAKIVWLKPDLRKPPHSSTGLLPRFRPFQVHIEKLQYRRIALDLVLLLGEPVAFVVKDDVLHRHPILLDGGDDIV
jgi:hypothetical protein